MDSVKNSATVIADPGGGPVAAAVRALKSFAFWRNKTAHFILLGVWIGLDRYIGRADVTDAAGRAAPWASFSFRHYESLWSAAGLYGYAWIAVCAALVLARRGRLFMASAFFYLAVQGCILFPLETDFLGTGLRLISAVEVGPLPGIAAYLMPEIMFFALAFAWFIIGQQRSGRRKIRPYAPEAADCQASAVWKRPALLSALINLLALFCAYLLMYVSDKLAPVVVNDMLLLLIVNLSAILALLALFWLCRALGPVRMVLRRLAKSPALEGGNNAPVARGVGLLTALDAFTLLPLCALAVAAGPRPAGYSWFFFAWPVLTLLTLKWALYSWPGLPRPGLFRALSRLLPPAGLWIAILAGLNSLMGLSEGQTSVGMSAFWTFLAAYGVVLASSASALFWRLKAWRNRGTDADSLLTEQAFGN